MDCFIKKIFTGNVDESVHRQFVRFGKGEYNSRAIIELKKGNQIKINSTFEYANDFVNLLKAFPVKFSGVIITKEIIPGLTGKKKSGLYEYNITMSHQELNNLNNYYFQLLDADGPGLKLKMKKKLPKPGKSEEKVDAKFCILQADLKYWQQIEECFFWDLPKNVKKAVIKHTYHINEIIFPEQEKDPAKIRLLSKRKGKIVRLIDADGQSSSKEQEFIV